MTDSKAAWGKFYGENSIMAFPPEGLIRIIKGGPYPGLSMPKPQPHQLIIDIGCGDGSAFPLYQQAGLHAHGVEISDDIVEKISTTFVNNGINGSVRTGCFSNIPWADDVFDYAVAWNSCYYMSIGTGKFEDHVAEMSRVLVPNGWLIVSVPNPDCFIWDNSTKLGTGRYRHIESEFFGLRSGEIMRCFHSTHEIEEEFGTHFTDFSHSTIDIHWFGLRYSWYVFTARKYTHHESDDSAD